MINIVQSQKYSISNRKSSNLQICFYYQFHLKNNLNDESMINTVLIAGDRHLKEVSYKLVSLN